MVISQWQITFLWINCSYHYKYSGFPLWILCLYFIPEKQEGYSSNISLYAQSIFSLTWKNGFIRGVPSTSTSKGEEMSVRAGREISGSLDFKKHTGQKFALKTTLPLSLPLLPSVSAGRRNYMACVRGWELQGLKYRGFTVQVCRARRSWMPCSRFMLLCAMGWLLCPTASGVGGLPCWGNRTLPPKGELKKFYRSSRARLMLSLFLAS